MVLSYSAAAQTSAATPADLATAPSTTLQSTAPEAISSNGRSNTSQPSPESHSLIGRETEAGPSKPRIKHLILDAGPLLSLTPLRNTAEHLYTTPAVVRELRDPKAREWFERLGLSGVEIRVEQPSADAMARVMAFARKTGDYAVLSATDLGVIALTLQYEMKENGLKNVRSEPVSRTSAATKPTVTSSAPSSIPSAAAQADHTAAESSEGHASSPGGNAAANQHLEGWYEGEASGGEEADAAEASNDKACQEEMNGDTQAHSLSDTAPDTQAANGSLAVQTNSLTLSEPASIPETITSATSRSAAQESSSTSSAASQASAVPVAVKEIDSESEAGEWITPSNVSKHRSRDLGLLPEGGKASIQPITAACMTGDFAVQNVLLAMGLGLVGEGGKRISKVRSWVLRCHACFKVCKDPSKKFCPSCGNPSLLRTSTTTTSNGKTHLHLKRNYQYNLRGTKFTIPDAKPGRAKGQQKGGTGLILREDQREWTDAVKREDVRRGKEEKKILKGWDDPDWLPEIITVGMSGKGRTGAHGLPTIGHGRKNPNIAKKKR